MVARELVEAGCDTAVVFDLVEAALDEIALPVDFWIDDAPDPDIALARDMSDGAAGLDQLDDGAGEEAAIGDDVARQGQPVNQCRKGRLAGGLAGREQEANRQTMGVDHSVDLGAQSSTRTADDVIRAPFLPPPGVLVGAHDRGVDQTRRARRLLRQGLEYPQPHAFLGPAVETFVRRRVRPVPLGQIAPWRARTQNEEDAIENAPIILARHPARLVRRKRCNDRLLAIRQVKSGHRQSFRRLEAWITTRP